MNNTYDLNAFFTTNELENGNNVHSVQNPDEISQQRFQRVVDEKIYDINKVSANQFKSIMMPRIEALRREKGNNISISEYMEVFLPQGAALSIHHKVSVPGVEQMVNAASNAFSSFSPSASFSDLKETLAGGIGGLVFFSLRYWISIVFILTFVINVFPPSDPRYLNHIKATRYIFMSLFLITCLIAPDEEDFEKRTFAEKAKDFFWEDIFPLWQQENETINMDSAEELEMGDVYFPQSFGEHVPKVSILLASMLSLLIGFKVKKHLIDALTSLTKVNSTQVTNITAFIVTISGCMAGLFSKMGQEELSKYFDIDVCDSILVSKFVSKATTFINKINAGDIYSSAFHSEVYLELIRDGEELARKADKGSYDSRLLGEVLKKLRDCSDKVQVIKKALNGTRIEPVGVLISGDPGCFKGVLAERLATIVGSHTIPSEWKEEYDADPKQFHFAVPNDKFFDRYNYKKWIATFDDIFQIRDTVGDPDSEAVRIIKMINSAEYVLPMSSVTEKNSMFFRSAFLFGTTNNGDVRVASVNSPDAVKRRFNVQIKVGISEKYKTSQGKTDLDKLPLISSLGSSINPVLSDSTIVPNDYWILNVTSRDGNNVIQDCKMSLEDVAVMIIEAHHKRIMNYYVNKHMDVFQHKTLANNLAHRLPRMELYSQMALNTFTAQGGLPGKYNSDKGYPQGRWRYAQAFQESDPEFQKEIAESYFMMLGRKLHIDLYSIGLSGLSNFMTTITDEESLVFGELFDTPFEFMDLVDKFFTDRMRNRMHPIMNHPLAKKSLDKKSILKSIKDSIKPFTSFVFNNKVIILIAGSLMMGGVFYLSGFFKSTVGNAFKSQSVDLSRDRGKVGKSVKLSQKLGNITLRPQAPVMEPISSDVLPKIDVSMLGHQSNANDVSVQILNKYLFIVYVIRPLGDSFDVIRLGHAWNVKGNVYMMPLHFMYKLHDVHTGPSYEGATLLFTTATKSTKYTCSLEDVLRSFKCSEDSANNDCCLFQIPSAHKSSVGMIKHIAKLGDFNRLKRLNTFKIAVSGTYLGKDRKSNSVRIHKTVAHILDTAYVKSDWQGTDELYKLEGVLKYDGDFGGGDCGSLLTIESNDFENRTVFGMHVAGECIEGRHYGISSVIVQEYIQLLMDDSYSNYHIFEDEENSPRLEQIPYTPQSGLSPVAKLTKDNITGEICASSLVKSALFGKLPEPYHKVVDFPARLLPFHDKKNDVTIDPGVKALNKYDKEPIHFPDGLVERAVASYEGLIMQHMPPTDHLQRTVTLKEALHAFDSVKGVSPSTSPGFPMNLPKEENIKKFYYKAVEEKNLEETLIHYERIAILVDNVLEKYSKGIRPATFYKGVLKDELRPLKKVLDGSTRYFSAYSFPMLLLFRMYFGGFMSSFIDANVKVGSAIGVNAYSKDWDQIARNLLKFSDKKTDKKIGAGDFSGFDTCHRVQIQMAILDMINRWYGSSNPDNHIRTKLWTDITNSKQIYRNEIYEWVNGMPSGNPLTSLINTIYNNVVFRMSYQLAGFHYSTFNNHVYMIAMGDDNVFTVCDELMEHFNEMTLVDLMAQCGMKYTTELKDVAVLPFRMITEVEFLKRKFKFDNSCNRWVAPMRLDSVFSTLNWTQKGIEGEQITADKVASTVSEISLHGRTVFNKLVPPLVKTLNENLPHVRPHKDVIINFDVVYSDILQDEFMY